MSDVNGVLVPRPAGCSVRKLGKKINITYMLYLKITIPDPFSQSRDSDSDK